MPNRPITKPDFSRTPARGLDLLLASLSMVQLGKIVVIRSSAAHTPASITNPVQLQHELALTRTRRYGMAVDEMEEGAGGGAGEQGLSESRLGSLTMHAGSICDEGELPC